MDGSSPLVGASRPRRRAWRPLQEALALLTTRSEAFADEVAADPGAGTCIELGLILRITWKQKEDGVEFPIVKSCNEAWLELRALIEDGEVPARGTAVDHHRKGLGSIDYPHPPGTLGPEQVSQLVLWEEPNDETWLRPDDKAIFGQGRHWKKVTIHWPSLVKAVFGKAHQQKAPQKNGPIGLGPEIHAAFNSEFPDGAPKVMQIQVVRKRLEARMNRRVCDKTFVRHGITKDKIRRKS